MTQMYYLGEQGFKIESDGNERLDCNQFASFKKSTVFNAVPPGLIFFQCESRQLILHTCTIFCISKFSNGQTMLRNGFSQIIELA